MTADGLVDRYLDVVGIERSAPTMALLEELTRRHVARFPFASIGPQLGDDLPLDVEALFDRIVVRRRGGYCLRSNSPFKVSVVCSYFKFATLIYETVTFSTCTLGPALHVEAMSPPMSANCSIMCRKI